MKRFYDFLNKYGLHDSVCNSIFWENGNICFAFNLGIYELLPNGKEKCLTNPCKMIVSLDLKTSQKAHQFMLVNQILHGKFDEIECEDFLQIVANNSFEIENHYFSPFNNTILLIGYSSCAQYEVSISNIKTISFSFD